jgi:NADH:ubiquinone reductase (H+-translocating)
MAEGPRKKIVIVGGGFGGVYAALELDKWLFRHPDVDVTIVNRDNFFLFTPMLHEVAASDLDITNIVSPVRKLVSNVDFFDGDVEKVDLHARTVTVSHGDGHTHAMPYDHLILAPGSVTNFFGLPGLEEGAITMKSLGDAITLRNRLIEQLEEAETECGAPERDHLMTFVVAGGGFAGVETIAGMNDFVHRALPFYPHVPPENVRMVLVHPGEVILPELSEKLGRYAEKKLVERGIDIRKKTKVAAVDGRKVTLSDGSVIEASTLIWTAGTQPNPLIRTLPCKTEKGRVCVDETLQVPGWPGVWAVGDCALVPDPATGGFHPPTAQHAIRQGRVLARNILASLRNQPARPFRFRTIGQLASLGRRTGVAQVLGLRFSGFVAWWMWRTIYLMKLPRLEKRLRVAIDWTWDLVFDKDLVKFLSRRRNVISRPKPAMQEELQDAMARAI